MSKFEIETTNLDNTSTAINSIANQISDLASSVNGYDTSCEDGFDFASPKSKISSNLEACVTKVQNTAAILNAVSQSHTSLQNSLKFEDSETAAKKKANSSSSGTSSGNGSSGGYSSGGGSYSGGAYVAGGTAAAAAARLRKTDKDTKTEKIVDITGSFKNVNYIHVKEDELTEESKKIFEHEDFKYDENGYAKIKDRYVVAVDKSLGKVGDILKFTQEDGTEIEVVVGKVTSDDKTKDTINFIISKDKEINEEFKEKAKEIIKAEEILKNNKKIENIGSIFKTMGSKDNAAMIDSIMNEVGNTISDYPGQGFNDGQWCADYVSYTLQKNGYDVKWSSLAGDGEGCIMQSIRDSGGVVHLDLGAKAKGLSNSAEYDPSYIPQKGDVVVFDFEQDGINDHTGFVIQDNGDGTVKTIEGNTSGEAGGSCVAIHDRDRSIIYGYATPVK